MRARLFFAVLSLLLVGAAQDETGKQEATPLPEMAEESELSFDWAPDQAQLRIPRQEHLVYRVRVGVGGIGAPVGVVTMDAGVEPYRESVLLLDQVNTQGKEECGWLRIHAVGDYQLFSLDSTIEARLNPRPWPWIVYRFKQQGAKNRQREVLIGWREEKPTLAYRRDTDTNAPKGTRIWKDRREREIPVSALDMLSASYYLREMVRGDRTEMVFPVADKLNLWQLHLRRGEARRFETQAGTFDAVQILLDPRAYPGEEKDERAEAKVETFEGLFGIHGSIELWVERETGIPLRIAGDLPVGPLELSIEVLLKSYEGTPEAFQPLSE